MAVPTITFYTPDATISKQVVPDTASFGQRIKEISSFTIPTLLYVCRVLACVLWSDDGRWSMPPKQPATKHTAYRTVTST